MVILSGNFLIDNHVRFLKVKSMFLDSEILAVIACVIYVFAAFYVLE